MNDIDRYLDQACRSVSGPVSLRKHLRKELKEHLEEAIKELVATGMSEDEATKKVIDDFGEPEMVCEGLQSVYGHSVTSLFVDKAMQWKENTMKSKWIWNFAVHFGLLMIIAAAVSCCVFILLWIVPLVTRWYHEIGAGLPAYYLKAISISVHIHNWWWVWLIGIVVVVGLFEWKCKSENKSMIRAAMSVGASLLSVGFAFYLIIATVIVLVLFPQVRSEHWNESFIASKAVSADHSYRRLALAMEKQDWPNIKEATHLIGNSYRILEHWDAMAIILPSETQYDGVKELRQLIREVGEKNDELRSAIYRHQELSVIQERFAELQEVYSRLKEKSKFFAKHTAFKEAKSSNAEKPIQ